MHLTYHDSDTHTGTASTAKAEETGAPDLEVTEAMILAGEDVLLAELGGAVSSHWSAPDLAKQVYLAMASCNPRARHQYR